MNPDPLAPARGIFHGLVIGSLCWAAIIAAIVALVLP
jgi:hypothetical protein